MAWEDVAGHRSRGKGNSKGKGGESGKGGELDRLAKELRAALMPAPHRIGSPVSQRPARKPEWKCGACGTSNFMDRRQCRQCWHLSPSAQSAPTPPASGASQRLPPGSVWAEPCADQRPAARATALEKARAVANSAGAPAEALAAMDGEIANLRSEAASSRPLGARLDSAKAKLAKAEMKVQSAEAQMQQLSQQLEEARAHRAAAQDALTELQAEVPQERVSAPDELLSRTVELLERLETGQQAWNLGMPEELKAAMTAVHRVVETLRPLQPPSLDTALEPEASVAVAADRSRKAEQALGEASADPEETVMDSLDDIDDADEEGLIAIARRLKRVRRS